MKKCWLVLVEGRSDADTLRRLDTLLQNRKTTKYGPEEIEIRLEPLVGGDIFTMWKSRFGEYFSPRDIKPEIQRKVQLLLKQNLDINYENITKIIQVTDADGVFVPSDDNHVRQRANINDNKEHIEYFDTYMETNYPDATKQRNYAKKNLLKSLTSKREKITVYAKCDENGNGIGPYKDVDYELYFIATNLDHFFNNDANLSSDQKIPCARVWRSKSEKEFVQKILSDDEYFGDTNNHESWEIMTNLESEIDYELLSLQQHTNLGCLVKELIDGRTEYQEILKK